MKKFAIGLVALIVLAAAAVFGANRYVQWRAESAVDDVFAELRKSGREAARGKVEFDFFAHRLTVDTISVREADGVGVSVAKLTVEGVSAPQNGQISARRIDARDVTVEISATAERAHAVYNVPHVTLENYAGPDTLLPRERGRYEALNLALRQMAAMRADKLSIPKVTVRTAPLGPRGVSSLVGYRDLVAERIADGRIARFAFEDMGFTFTAPEDQPDLAAKGSLKTFVATDFDTAPLLSATRSPAPSGPGTVYGRIVASGWTQIHGDGTMMEIGEMSVDTLTFEPSLDFLGRLEEASALGEKGPVLSAADRQKMLEVTGDLTKAFGFKQAQVKNVALTGLTGVFKFSDMTLANQKQGRLDLFTLDTLTGPAEDGKPFMLERLVLKGLSPLPILAASARSDADAQPGAETALALLRSLEGVELKGLSVPLPGGDVPLKMETLSLDWGNFIGLVPTRIGLKLAGLTSPLSPDDVFPLGQLAGAGLKEATMGVDLAIGYDAASGTVRLAPGTMRVDQAFAADISMSLTQVRAQAFEDPIAALAAAQQIALGPITAKLTDLGLIELELKAWAKDAGVSEDDMRTQTADVVRKMAADLAPLYPDAPAIGEALARFWQQRGTLTVTLTPVGTLRLIDLMAADLDAALKDFRITATTTP